jgi:hypothetical protein
MKEFFKRMVKNLKIEQLIELNRVLKKEKKKNLTITCTEHNLCSQYVTKNGTLYFTPKLVEYKKNEFHQLLREQILSTIAELSYKKFEKNNIKFDVCYINANEMKNIVLKKGKQEQASKFTTKTPSTRGDTIDLNEFNEKDTEFVLFDQWKHSSHIYLDLTLFGLDQNFNLVHNGISDFGNKHSFNGKMIHRYYYIINFFR